MDTTKESIKEKAIIMAGNAASRAALKILTENEEQLKKRYSGYYLEGALNILQTEKDVRKTAGEADTQCCISCSEGGVFEALWKLGEELESGLTVELSKIPILQYTIEFCDHMDINPYEADSTGCVVLTAKEPGKVLTFFRERGCRAELIGYTAPEKARIIRGSTVRYLTKS